MEAPRIGYTSRLSAQPVGDLHEKRVVGVQVEEISIVPPP